MARGGIDARSALLKATRRLGRTVRTEAKLFMARPTRPRPWTKPCIFGLGAVSIIWVLVYLFWPGELRVVGGHIRSDGGHFSHNTKVLLPRQRAWEKADLKPCSWVYLEVNAGDGHHMRSFFNNGNSFLEEYLRGSQASMRGFCAVAIETDPQMGVPLATVRREKGNKARRFDVFSGVAAGAEDGVESVRFVGHTDPGSGKDGKVVGEQETENVRTVNLARVVNQLTYPLSESGVKDAAGMSIAVGNRNNGTVIVRLNVADMKEAYWYLDLLDTSTTLCDRVDRLIINLEPMSVDPGRHFLIDRKAARDFDNLFVRPTNYRFEPSNGKGGIKEIAELLTVRPGCRTVAYVIDAKGEVIHPPMLPEKAVHYSILAGQPTFDERISAQTASWMSGVPKERITIFTNAKRSAAELVAANGIETVVTQPNKPALEKQIRMMQSWSHLVRVRETWDRTMKDDNSIQWLLLVDDDTFVFPGGMREYLRNFDPRMRLWGGSGEQARIDNGDHGKFATWLRNLNTKHGGKHCYLPNEDIPEHLKGRKIQYGVSSVMNGRRVAKIVSHMCGDMFCRRGCPAVPQGAAIFLSRALVAALRPFIEQCEEETSSLCKNCGSQRLYMCVNHLVAGAQTLMTRGVCRATWRLERREMWPFALTYHGFQKYKRLSLSTRSILGDMQELWQLGKSIEESAKMGLRKSYYVPIQRVADLIGCRGQGTYRGGKCVTPDGVVLNAHDGGKGDREEREGHRAGDRKGSA